MLTPLPIPFVERISKSPLFGQNVLEAFDSSAPTSIRLNPNKSTTLDFELGEKVPWCNLGHYLTERPNFTLDPLFHAGIYYPQEAASMSVYEIVKSLTLPENPIVLDACAAPGGKSTALLEALPANGVLVANEMNRHRCNVLAENISKWGNSNVLVTHSEVHAFSKHKALFDLVLIDAPCSGEGMFRKDLNARTEWSLENVKLCAERQLEIVNQLADTVKEDGYLMYSTCTLNKEENEEIIQHLIENHAFEACPLPFLTNALPSEQSLGYYFAPGISKSEGLYICLLRKIENDKPSLRKNKQLPPIKTAALPDYIQINANDGLVQEDEKTYLMSQQTLSLYEQLRGDFRFMKKGTLLGETAMKGFVPAHEFALSTALINTLPRAELSLLDARKYLHGDTFPLIAEKGFVVVTYRDSALGLVKNLGNRFNNLYPKEWRIRMAVS
jgi:16S rRNA C967 or C1407 C5-methylase (RsmB/RsmF family)/NOL1/NOP2/fmu family ribosome biogenesis protein